MYWHCYVNTLSDSFLQIGFYKGHPPWPDVMFFEKPVEISKIRYHFDLARDGSYFWFREGGLQENIISNRLVEVILEKVMQYEASPSSG